MTQAPLGRRGQKVTQALLDQRVQRVTQARLDHLERKAKSLRWAVHLMKAVWLRMKPCPLAVLEMGFGESELMYCREHTSLTTSTMAWEDLAIGLGSLGLAATSTISSRTVRQLAER